MEIEAHKVLCVKNESTSISVQIDDQKGTDLFFQASDWFKDYITMCLSPPYSLRMDFEIILNWRLYSKGNQCASCGRGLKAVCLASSCLTHVQSVLRVESK